MRSYPVGFRATAVAFGLAVLTACGTGAGGGDRPCTLIGSRQGIGLEIPAPYAGKVAKAAMTICWNGACRRPNLHLTPSTKAVPQGCTGDAPDDTCGAVASPDGGKRGFAEVTGLPATPVQVTVVLRDARGARLLDQKISVTPHVTYPNGKECGAGAPQAQLVVADGKVTVRR
jgi:hypothetical protein